MPGELGKQVVTLAGYSVDLRLPEAGMFTGFGRSLSEIGEDSLEPADLGVSEYPRWLLIMRRRLDRRALSSPWGSSGRPRRR